MVLKHERCRRHMKMKAMMDKFGDAMLATSYHAVVGGKGEERPFGSWGGQGRTTQGGVGKWRMGEPCVDRAEI